MWFPNLFDVFFKNLYIFAKNSDIKQHTIA